MQNVWLYNYNNYNTVAHHAIHTYINCTVAMYVCSRAAQDMMKCTVLISESWYEQLTQQQDSTAISAPWLSSCTESRLLIDQCRTISRSSFLCTCCFQYMRIYVHSYVYTVHVLRGTSHSYRLWISVAVLSVLCIRWSFSVTFYWRLLCSWPLSALAMEIKVS